MSLNKCCSHCSSVLDTVVPKQSTECSASLLMAENGRDTVHAPQREYLGVCSLWAAALPHYCGLYMTGNGRHLSGDCCPSCHSQEGRALAGLGQLIPPHCRDHL